MISEINDKLLQILFEKNEGWHALQFASGQGQLYLWDGMPEELMFAGVLFGLEKCNGCSFHVFHQSIAKKEAMLSKFAELPSSGQFLPMIKQNKTESVFSLGGGFLKLWSGMPRDAMLTSVSFALSKSRGMEFRIDPATEEDRIEILAAINGIIDKPGAAMLKRNMPGSKN